MGDKIDKEVLKWIAVAGEGEIREIRMETWEKVIASLRQFFPLLEALNDGIIFLNPERIFLYANGAALKMLGKKKLEDIYGKRLEEILIERDRERCVSYYNDLSEKGKGRIILSISGRKNNAVEINSSVFRSGDKVFAFREVLHDMQSVEDMESSLEMNEVRLSTLINYVPGIVYYSRGNRESNLFYANEYISSITGYPQSDFISNKRNFLDLIYPPDYERNLPILNYALKHGTSYELEYRVIHKNGSIRWLSDRGRAVKDGTGKVQYITGISFDVTERKRVEAENRENEERLNAVFDNPALGVVVIDLQGNFLKANDTIVRMLGYSRKQLMKMNVYDITHPDDVSNIVKAIRKMIADNKRTTTYEKRVIRKDGHYIWTRVSISMIPGEEGKPGYMVAFAEDITAQKNIREKLEESEERYRTLVTSMPGVVFNCTLEADWEVFYISAQIVELSGYRAEEFLTGKKRKFGTIIHPDDKEHIVNKLPHPEKSPSSYTLEYRIFHKDGSIRWVHEAGQVYFDKKSNGYCLTGVMIDITARVVAEQRQQVLMNNLQRALREVNEFAHIVSHDLKAPLRGISSLSTWLYEDYNDKLDEEGRKNLLLLQDRVEKMDGLIDGILAYSAVTKGSKQIEDVDLNKVLDAILNMLELPKDFKIGIKKKLPVVRANNYHMYQLFQNIISNAIKYCDKPEGRVEISFNYEDGMYHFSIRDNGIGIPKEYQHKIFDIFQTLQTGNRKSSGVGLSIVKKIVELYQGNISVESEPGAGTVFHFSIAKEADWHNTMLNERK